MRTMKSVFLMILLVLTMGLSTVMGDVCDVDNDQDIDSNDINAIMAARNKPADGPDDPRDANGDGIITVNDGRQCVLQCDLPRCAIVDQNNVDNDGDGFTENEDDCDDTNAAIHPEALDIPGNAIDENCDGEDAQLPPPADVPLIDVHPNPLDLGEVVVDQYAGSVFTIENAGEAELEIYDIFSSDPAFTIILPWTDTLQPGQTAEIGVVFHPTYVGPFQGTITISSNADNGASVQIQVTGTGIQPPAEQVPDIDTHPRIDFGCAPEATMFEQILEVRNAGTATLYLSGLTTDQAIFEARPITGDSLPLSIEPGQSRNVVVRFTPPAGSAGTDFFAALSLASNDPDEAIRTVQLAGCATAPQPPAEQNPIVGASVSETITAANCAGVAGAVEFTADSSAGATFQVTLTDAAGTRASGAWIMAPEGAATVPFSGIDACALLDGVMQVSVVYRQDGDEMAPFIGTPAVKNTSSLPPPILEPLPPVTSLATIQVCGTSRENTTVRIEGGAYTATVSLGAGTTHFCVDVPLRPNAQNILIASAVDDVAPAPKPVAYAQPVAIVQLDPSQVVISRVDVRELTESEIAQLVANGVIDLDDPDNFNVSMFTIVLTIGSTPVRISQPVVHPRGGGGGTVVSYGSGGGWVGGGGGGGGISAPGQPGGGSGIIVITPPSGRTIPGIIIIDGRIKTLKEFFQATLLLFNNSETFVLQDMQAAIDLPPGLTPMGAAAGTDVSLVNTQGQTNQTIIGDVGPGQTGAGQFIFRGDAMGVHTLRVDFKGFIAEGGLPAPVPVNGAVSTSVLVQGPPELKVVVRHPSNPDGPDVTLNQIYDLIVEITNLSSRPALYTSLDLFVGGNARLVDENNLPIPSSNLVRTIGTIPAGRTASLTYRVQSLAEGEIIACQGIASENITLSVDTGPGGTCNINNMYPSDFKPLPEDMPPTVIGINPLNGQPNIPVTTSIVAVLTPRTDCLTADTWTNIVTRPIGGNPANGLEVVSATLATSGTFYLEELDPWGEPVRHVPAELVIENPPAGGTTIAVLRLGLRAPLSQTFLKPNTRYRATLVGGDDGLCSAASGATMPQTFSWIFSTAQDCTITGAFTFQNSTPADGDGDVPVHQAIELNFSNRIDLSSLRFVPGDLAASTFGVYQGATESGGDLSNEGTAVAGILTISNLNSRLTFTPSSDLPEDAQIFVRLTEQITDVCGQPLQTAGGVELIAFQTAPPDTTAPESPQVQPVPAATNATQIAVTGVAEPLSRVRILGGALPVTTNVPDSGLFNALVMLNADATHSLQVQAVDAAGNASPWVTVDINGNPLTVIQDASPPAVASINPAYGATEVLRETSIQVTFSEPVASDSTIVLAQGGVAVPGVLSVQDTIITFTPNEPLSFGATYTILIPATAVRDRAGNGLASQFQSGFTVEVENLTPAAVIGPHGPVPVGTTLTLDGSGSSDPNGDPISFQWELISRPAGSNAVLSNAATATPSFIADAAGSYTIQLVVSDGKLTSPPAQAVITTSNTRPTADAGPDQTVDIGATVHLNGSNSADIDGDTLTYQWTLSRPTGSTAQLSGAATATPTFTVDRAGDYTATLMVNDGTQSSGPDTVTISTLNSKPVANAGPDQVVGIGSTVTLDGSGSNDVDGDAITYQWTLRSAPDGSAATLINATAASPALVPDLSGEYIVQLIVSDGTLSSDPATVTITAGTPPPPSLNYGDLVSGEISAVAEEDLYTFHGSANDDVLITIVETSGYFTSSSVEPRATLISPAGIIVTTFLANSQPSLALTETGTYLIRVNAENLSGTGGYNIGLERLRPVVAVVDDTLSPGELKSGAIGQPGETDLITFEGTEGESVLITLVETGGSFTTSSVEPYFTLYAPSGAVVTSYAANSQPQIALSETGTYVLRVIAQDLVHTGTYNIGLD